MRKIYFLMALFAAVWQTAWSQSPNDALMMPKHQLCILGQYTHGSWDEYWEGETKRSNSNLGTVTNSNVLLMGNYGITDRLNVLLGLPYVWTDSDSYLEGQHGIQDLMLFVKFQALEKAAMSGRFKVQVTGGLSTPITKYVPDFQPFSIGAQSKTASLRGILNYTADMGLYITLQGGHTWRSNADIDGEAYLFEDQLYYGSTVPVPNVLDGSARLGFINSRIQAEVWGERSTGLTGDDIRYNSAPFLTNKMQWTAVGVFAKYYVTKQLGISASYSQVLSGRNVGQSTTISGGVNYFFTLHKESGVQAPK